LFVGTTAVVSWDDALLLAYLPSAGYIFYNYPLTRSVRVTLGILTLAGIVLQCLIQINLMKSTQHIARAALKSLHGLPLWYSLMAVILLCLHRRATFGIKQFKYTLPRRGCISVYQCLSLFLSIMSNFGSRLGAFVATDSEANAFVTFFELKCCWVDLGTNWRVG